MSYHLCEVLTSLQNTSIKRYIGVLYLKLINTTSWWLLNMYKIDNKNNQKLWPQNIVGLGEITRQIRVSTDGIFQISNVITLWTEVQQGHREVYIQHICHLWGSRFKNNTLCIRTGLRHSPMLQAIIYFVSKHNILSMLFLRLL